MDLQEGENNSQESEMNLQEGDKVNLIIETETTISGNSCSAIFFSLRYVISASNC